MKKCVRCFQDLPDEAFAVKNKGSYRNWCKPCDAARKRAEDLQHKTELHSNVLRVSDELGKLIHCADYMNWLRG